MKGWAKIDEETVCGQLNYTASFLCHPLLTLGIQAPLTPTLSFLKDFAHFLIKYHNLSFMSRVSEYLTDSWIALSLITSQEIGKCFYHQFTNGELRPKAEPEIEKPEGIIIFI